MSSSEKPLSIPTHIVDIDALERELFSALNHSSTEEGRQDSQPTLEDSTGSDDILMQLAIESELAINNPKVLQERKKYGLPEATIQNDVPVHLKELDSLLDNKSALDARSFSLNQKQEFDLLLNNQMGIDSVINSLSDEALGESDPLHVEDSVDPLMLFQIGDKPVLHSNVTMTDNSMTDFVQQEQYQSSLDSVIPISSFHSDGSGCDQRNNINDHVSMSSSSFVEYDDSVEDILDLILPTNGQK